MEYSTSYPLNNASNLEEASTQRVYLVHKTDLPLCCPMPQMRLWDSHPRVYLPIEETNREVCPYCGSEFILMND